MATTHQQLLCVIPENRYSSFAESNVVDVLAVSKCEAVDEAYNF